MARPQRIYHVQRGGTRLQIPRSQNDDDEEVPESDEADSDGNDEEYEEKGNSSESSDDKDVDGDDDYDDEDDFVVPANNGRKRTRGVAVAKRPTRARRNILSKSYKEVDEDEEFEYESDTEPPKAKPPGQNRRRGKGTPRNDRGDENSNVEESIRRVAPRRHVFADLEDEGEESYEAEDDEDDMRDEDYESEKEVKKQSRTASRKRGRPKKIIHDDDDEAEFESEAEVEKAANTPQPKRGRPKKKIHDDDDEAEFESEGEDEIAARRPQPKRGRPKKIIHDDDEEAEFESEGEDEKAAPQPKRGRPKKKRGRPKKSVNDDESDDDEDMVWTPKSRKAVPGPSSGSTRRSSRIAMSTPPTFQNSGKNVQDYDSSSADLDDDDDVKVDSPFPASNSRRTTPARVSATIASRNISSSAAKLKAEDSSDDQSEVSASVKKPHLSSDEEFLEDDSEVDGVHETDSDDIEDDEGIEEDDSSLDDPQPEIRSAYNVDAEQLGTMDDSSSDEDENTFRPTPDKNQSSGRSRLSELTPRPHRPKYKGNSSSSESSDSEIDNTRAKKRDSVRPRLPPCPSTEDAITGETLPRRHVCYFSPDGSSRQCFALETLRQIALTSSQRHFRTDLIGDNLQCFLQPPHFRTVMSAFLVDQIASRFGRQALDIHGDFYNRKPSDLRREDDSVGSSASGEDEIFNEVGGYHYSQSFFDDLQKYIDRQMGSQDIYACPLCYSEMHARIDSPSQEEDSRERGRGSGGIDEDSTRIVESKYDPMLVLGYLDDDQFQGASCFCFTKVANLKKHLRDDHHVETKGIQGNDLYARFKIRAPDGLLQRYLEKAFKSGTTRQGDMRRYWNEGNNYSFVLLLHMMQKAEWYRSQLGGSQDDDISGSNNHGDSETADDFFALAHHFFDSFQDRATSLWRRLSSPFRTTKADDLRDFLANDDDEVEEPDSTHHIIAHREVDSLIQGSKEDANDLISKIQRKYVEYQDTEYDDGNVDEGDGDDSDDSLLAGKPSAMLANTRGEPESNGYYSVEEEETDPWVKGIQQRRRSKSSKEVSPDETPRIKKKIIRKSGNGSLSTSAKKRRSHALEDSDSDFEG